MSDQSYRNLANFLSFYHIWIPFSFSTLLSEVGREGERDEKGARHYSAHYLLVGSSSMLNSASTTRQLPNDSQRRNLFPGALQPRDSWPTLPCGSCHLFSPLVFSFSMKTKGFLPNVQPRDRKLKDKPSKQKQYQNNPTFFLVFRTRWEVHSHPPLTLL